MSYPQNPSQSYGGGQDVSSSEQKQAYYQLPSYPNTPANSTSEYQEASTTSSAHSGTSYHHYDTYAYNSFSPNTSTTPPNNSTYATSVSPPQHPTQHHWHAVPRPWAAQNPETYQTPQPQTYYNHPTTYQYGYAATTHANPQGNSAPVTSNTQPTLTLSNLHQLSTTTQSPNTNMTLWVAEPQRDAAWNSIAYVQVEDEVQYCEEEGYEEDEEERPRA
ncbi:hypothetical protein BDV95DRAFT_596157 [Massariosphaeria phaeospora]|uniref:Uncharacterized protein n=1 Tax=Massariosphaeria phaeospora TaxID=100035 RepID=A0A7C8M7F2_9PLEO|nr:hypothetical protein BDV95DRAFT_596157 [Massariosphaeria phaeospora]